jgi:hypothetical protein
MLARNAYPSANPEMNIATIAGLAELPSGRVPKRI